MHFLYSYLADDVMLMLFFLIKTLSCFDEKNNYLAIVLFCCLLDVVY